MATNLAEVRRSLEIAGVDFMTSIQDLSAFNTVLVEVPNSRISETVGKGVVTRRQLRSLAMQLSESLGCVVEFLVNGDPIRHSYAKALEDLLSRKFGQADYTVAIALSPLERCVVWVDARKASTPNAENGIRDLVSGFLSGIGMIAEHVHVLLPTTRHPSDMEILRAVKVEAPVTIERLKAVLLSGNDSSIEDKWLKARLDNLRKKNLVHWAASGQYVLTELALTLVPVTRTKKSSDVSRALHLARRKW